MTVEFNQLVKLMSDASVEQEAGCSFTHGTLGHHEVILMQCGIGKVNAAMGTTILIDRFHPQCVISTGCAGGIDACLDVMDVVVSRQCVYHDMYCGPVCKMGQVQGLPARFEGDVHLLEAACSLQGETRIHAGLICTGDRFITSREELNQIKTAFPEGLAVDMESCAIAQVCYLQQVPFVSFRIISDTPGADKHQQQYENFWGMMADRSFGVTRDFLLAIR